MIVRQLVTGADAHQSAARLQDPDLDENDFQPYCVECRGDTLGAPFPGGCVSAGRAIAF